MTVTVFASSQKHVKETENFVAAVREPCHAVKDFNAKLHLQIETNAFLAQ
jgi:hypothetical protein